MVKVTKNAKGLLQEMLISNADDPEIGMRLVVNPQGQLGIMLDKEETGDQVIEYLGTRALFTASELALELAGIILDVEDTGDGPKLVVQTEKL